MKNLTLTASLSLGLVAALCPTLASAGIIATYLDNDIPTTTALPQPPTSVASHATATNLTPASYSGTGGSQWGFSGTFDNFFALTNITHGYLEFTLTAAPGYKLDLSSFTVALGGSSSTVGFTSTVSLTSSVLGHATPISGVNTSNAIPGGTNASSSPPFDFQAATFDLSAPTYQNLSSITFRLATGDDANDSNLAVRIDNIVVNGQVALVPEPASLALLVGGALLMLPRRTKKG